MNVAQLINRRNHDARVVAPVYLEQLKNVGGAHRVVLFLLKVEIDAIGMVPYREDFFLPATPV